MVNSFNFICDFSVFYSSLPDHILIARSFFGNQAVTAEKSLFTVFRVPLIEAVCAAAVELMRRRFATVNLDAALMWSILLYTISLKSMVQSFETVSTGNTANIFFYLTVGVVASGITTALFVGRQVLTGFSRSEWSLSISEKALLILLLLCYLGLAIVPIMIYK